MPRRGSNRSCEPSNSAGWPPHPVPVRGAGSCALTLQLIKPDSSLKVQVWAWARPGVRRPSAVLRYGYGCCGTVAVRSAARSEVAQPAERTAGRWCPCGALLQSLAGEVGDQDLTGPGQLHPLPTAEPVEQRGSGAVPSCSYRQRGRAALFGQCHGAGAFVSPRLARHQSACRKPVHQTHRPGMGEAEDLAQLAKRAVGREVQQRHERRRRSTIHPCGF
jgi:hypothetical protein